MNKFTAPLAVSTLALAITTAAAQQPQATPTEELIWETNRQAATLRGCLLPDVTTAQAYPGRWVGGFIWGDGGATPYHYHQMARARFDVPAPPRATQIKITAPDKYLLWVNGQYLGRGPARSARPQWTSYDTYDAYGKMLRPPQPTNIKVVSWTNSGRVNQVPAVFHSAWQAPDGRIGLVFANWTKEIQHFQALDSRLRAEVLETVSSTQLKSRSLSVSGNRLELARPPLSCALVES
jgi:hypothetical protein